MSATEHHKKSLDLLVASLTGKDAELIFTGSKDGGDRFKDALDRGNIPILLPVRFLGDSEYLMNMQYIEVLTALQAGRLLYGGAILSYDGFQNMVEQLYDAGLRDSYEDAIWNLDQFFDKFKEKPDLAKMIFEAVESARINAHLKRDYLGYKQIMEDELPRIFHLELINQTGFFNMNDVDSAVITLLQYQLFLGDLPVHRRKAEHNKKVIPVFNKCLPIAQRVLKKNATLADSFIATIQLYDIIYEKVKRIKESKYKEKPRLLKGLDTIVQKKYMIIADESTLQRMPIFRQTKTEKKEETLTKFVYPEWNSEKNKYIPGFGVFESEKMSWRRTERNLKPNPELVNKIRDEFALLKPEGRTVLKKQRSGELDYERYVQYKTDLAAGVTPDERIYKKVLNRKRDLAALVLIDLSGSVNKWVSEDRQLIDVIAESVYYLSCGVSELGDLLGVYGYASVARTQTYFEPIAAFGEAHPDNYEFKSQLQRITGMQQNQDGLAIRHATKKLLDTGRKNLLLIHISDGEPESVYLKVKAGDVVDKQNAELPVYKGDYAWHDVRRSLSEARAAGVLPVCIRVNDQKSKGLEQAYGIHYKILPDPLNLRKVLCSTYKDLIA